MAPTARLLPFTTSVAVPAATTEVPRVVAPIENVTLPVGLVAPVTAATVAVSVVLAVAAILAALAVSVMVVPTPGV